MKKYTVLWKKPFDDLSTVVMITDDEEKAYDYAAKKLPHGMASIVYSDKKIEFRAFKG